MTTSGTQTLKRVAITGLGAVTSIGCGKDGLWQGVLRGESAVRRITRFDPSEFRSQVAAEVSDFDVRDFGFGMTDHKRLRRMDRFSQFGIASASMALEDAKLQVRGENAPYAPDEVAVLIGSALGGVAYAEEQHTEYVKGGARALNPMLALSVFGGAAGCNVAIEFGFTGPLICNSNSCASGAVAIGEAFHMIRRGDVRAAITGGVEAPLAPVTYGAFSIIRAMSDNNDHPEQASRPFDKDRDGFVMAEGAGVLVLEEMESALRRGAHIYGELLGYATTNDAFHMAAPLPTGDEAARCVRLALAEAGIAPNQIGYINAHASSTTLNDKTETLALKKALGAAAYDIPISGTKGMHGHALGATGAMEAVICALALQEDYLPTTTNLDTPDPDCDLHYIQGAHGLHKQVNTILSDSFGFGGLNAALVFGRV